MKLYLGSKSPRRRELLKGAGLSFILANLEADEKFPSGMDHETVAEFLAVKKSKAYSGDLMNSILLTADTIVCLGTMIINKPEDESHAVEMLTLLSGKMHSVYTGVCLRTETGITAFTDKTNVYFKELSREQINYYVKKFKPLDKAGAYGIQEWIGYTGIQKIEGDFFNVMGLPVNRVYDALIKLGYFNTLS